VILFASQFHLPLRAEGCDEFQGYYCRPPLEEPELMRFLGEERANRDRPRLPPDDNRGLSPI
jgi:hypothetical protein